MFGFFVVRNLFFFFFFFFFNDTATTEIYTLSLHDALPIYVAVIVVLDCVHCLCLILAVGVDRKSTRLNSSHGSISYAVFCLKKKKKKHKYKFKEKKTKKKNKQNTT